MTRIMPMRGWSLLIGALLALSPARGDCGSPPAPAGRSRIERELLAVEAAWDDAVVRKDRAALERFPLALDRTFTGLQRFHDHAELLAKVQVMGECSVRRIEEYRDRRDFNIAMPYRVALLKR